MLPEWLDVRGRPEAPFPVFFTEILHVIHAEPIHLSCRAPKVLRRGREGVKRVLRLVASGQGGGFFLLAVFFCLLHGLLFPAAQEGFHARAVGVAVAGVHGRVLGEGLGRGGFLFHVLVGEVLARREKNGGDAVEECKNGKKGENGAAEGGEEFFHGYSVMAGGYVVVASKKSRQSSINVVGIV